MNRQPRRNPNSSALESARQLLTIQKERIHELLRNYPTPVAGCDDQFNYLLEERDRIAQELAALENTD